MKNTRYLKMFKKNIGNVNHLLITICIGLDGVRKGEITKGETFSTTWKPKNIRDSADRSRIFAIKATLIWLIDNMEVYFSNILKKPYLLEDQQKCEEISNIKGVYNKYKEIIHCIGIDNEIETAFIDLAISWRNKVVHTNANNDIDIISRKILNDNREFIRENYCGLDIIETLESFDKNESPSFKEITSLISSAINFVYLLDNKLIEQIDIQRYTNSIIEYEKDKELKNSFTYSDKKSKIKKVEHLLEVKYAFEKEDFNSKIYLHLG